MLINVMHIQTDINVVLFKLLRKCFLPFEVMVEGFRYVTTFGDRDQIWHVCVKPCGMLFHTNNTQKSPQNPHCPQLE